MKVDFFLVTASTLSTVYTGMFSLDYPETVSLHFRENSEIKIAVSVCLDPSQQLHFTLFLPQAVLTACPQAAIEVETFRGNHTLSDSFKTVCKTVVYCCSGAWCSGEICDNRS